MIRPGIMLASLMPERRDQADGCASDPEVLASFSVYFGTHRINTVEGVIRYRVTASLNHPANSCVLIYSRTGC